jgi:Tfp pilus assembly protein PilO
MWWPIILLIVFLIAVWAFWRYFARDMEHLENE